VYRVEHAKSAGRDHSLAATPAAVANETDLLANVFADLNEIIFIGLIEQVQTLGYVNGSPETMPD
jgi:hypothetical protein